MKHLFKFSLILIVPFLFIACSDDDDNTPEPVNEEEVITTVTVTLVPQGGGTNIILLSRDLDGDGPNDPVVTVSGDFNENTTYNGSIQFLNETESPAEDITEEVREEDDEHQVFFFKGGGFNASFTYEDFDGDGNPLGTLFTMETGAASSGTVSFILRHEPEKPNDGTLADAGGETDVSVIFEVESL